MNLAMAGGFSEISETEMLDIDGGNLLVIIAGAIVAAIIYIIANEVCKDFTGKTIGKLIADELFPAN